MKLKKSFLIKLNIVELNENLTKIQIKTVQFIVIIINWIFGWVVLLNILNILTNCTVLTWMFARFLLKIIVSILSNFLSITLKVHLFFYETSSWVQAGLSFEKFCALLFSQASLCLQPILIWMICRGKPAWARSRISNSQDCLILKCEITRHWSERILMYY